MNIDPVAIITASSGAGLAVGSFVSSLFTRKALKAGAETGAATGAKSALNGSAERLVRVESGQQELARRVGKMEDILGDMQGTIGKIEGTVNSLFRSQEPTIFRA